MDLRGILKDKRDTISQVCIFGPLDQSYSCWSLGVDYPFSDLFCLGQMIASGEASANMCCGYVRARLFLLFVVYFINLQQITNTYLLFPVGLEPSCLLC